jgi:hypothetical protein
MHVRGLVELAGILTFHGPLLLSRSEPLSADGIEQYWTTSKVRLDRWAWRLKKVSQQSDSRSKRQRAQWPAACSAMEEILTSEILTRVWTALVSAHDRLHDRDDAEPIARSVLIGHMEARHRVLTLMVRGPGIDVETTIRLNRLRRRAERWTDLLIGHLPRRYDVSEFAVDPQRAREFADDVQQRSRLAGGRHTWPLISASLRAAFRSGLNPASPNADLNARIANSILACFPADMFDTTGLLRSAWLTRLSTITDEAQAMIASLLAEPPASPSKPGATLTQGPSRFSRRNRPG